MQVFGCDSGHNTRPFDQAEPICNVDTAIRNALGNYCHPFGQPFAQLWIQCKCARHQFLKNFRVKYFQVVEFRLLFQTQRAGGIGKIYLWCQVLNMFRQLDFECQLANIRSSPSNKRQLEIYLMMFVVEPEK